MNKFLRGESLGRWVRAGFQGLLYGVLCFQGSTLYAASCMQQAILPPHDCERSFGSDSLGIPTVRFPPPAQPSVWVSVYISETMEKQTAMKGKIGVRWR